MFDDDNASCAVIRCEAYPIERANCRTLFLADIVQLTENEKHENVKCSRGPSSVALSMAASTPAACVRDNNTSAREEAAYESAERAQERNSMKLKAKRSACERKR